MVNSSLQEPVETCPHCGAERVYECQLMPQAVFYLQMGLQRGMDLTRTSPDPARPLCPEKAVEFGTVIIYSCSKSCWDQGGRGDQCKVQDEKKDQNRDLNQSGEQNYGNKDQHQDYHRSHTHWDYSDKLLDRFRREIIVVQREE